MANPLSIPEGRRREMLLELLARGVPWPLALEAVASSALDNDERAQTLSIPQEPPD